MTGAPYLLGVHGKSGAHWIYARRSVIASDSN